MFERVVKIVCFSAFLYSLLQIADEILCSNEWKLGPHSICSPNGGKKYSLDARFVGGTLQCVLFFLALALIMKQKYERYYEKAERKAIFAEDNVENEYEKELKDYPGHIEPQFIDPITYEWMKDPVVLYTENGAVSASYDESTVKRILVSENPNDPLTNKPIKGYIKNLFLKQLIIEDVAAKNAEMEQKLYLLPKKVTKKRLLASQSMFAKYKPTACAENKKLKLNKSI